MTDLFLQIGLSNACFSLAMAVVAVVVGATVKRPHLTNLLWLLVFVKLITPPLVAIPVVPIPGQSDTAVAAENHSQSALPLAGVREFDVSRPAPPQAASHAFIVDRPGVDRQPGTPLSASIWSAAFKHGRRLLPPIWLFGSVVVLVWSLARVCRFSRLLTAESQAAPRQLQAAAVKIARQLGLKTIPTICTTSAHLSPMVWWTGGKVRVIIPTSLLDQMDSQELKWILSHELAHVRRRDYLVRWLEWLACVGFWWNPVVWWAQKNLRATEEICCDALVISSLNPKPRSYAKSILTAVESLVRPAIRPPAMASEVNSGGFLERRFKMILSVSENPSRSKSRCLQAFVLLCAMIVLPLGVASAQDYDAVWKRLQAAVKKGEISEKQAHMMMGSLKKAAGENKGRGDKKHRDTDKPNIEQLGKRLKAAVASGQLSEKDARAKWEAITKHAKSGKEHAGGQNEQEKVHARLREIWAKLQHAVKEGKISKEDAGRKMGEIKRQALSGFEGRDKHDRGEDERKKAESHLREVREHLHRAIREGKISEEDARRKMEEVERDIRSRFEGRDKHDRGGDERQKAEAHLREVGEHLRRAVREGKMSEEDARRKMEEVERQIRSRFEGRDKHDRGGDERKKVEAHLREVREKLHRAVREGKMSEEDARRKMEEVERDIRSRFEGGDKRKRGGDERKRHEQREHGKDDRAWEAHIRGIWEQLQHAVKEGNISEEEARKKMGEIKKILYSSGRKDQKPAPAREHLNKIERELGAAVKAGKISREDAAMKFQAAENAIRKRMAGGRDRPPARKPAQLNWDNIRRRIEGAVKRGDMTRKEADVKYREIKERRGGRHEH